MTAPRSARRRVTVVGGGIAGLAAAFLLAERGLDVTVLEGSPRLGGKLTVSEVAGVPVDAPQQIAAGQAPGGHRPHRRRRSRAGAGAARHDRRRDLDSRAGQAAAAAAVHGRARRFWRARRHWDPLGGRTRPGPSRICPRPAAEPRIDIVKVTSRVGGRFGAGGGGPAGRAAARRRLRFYRCEDLSFRATLPALAQAARDGGSLAAAAARLLPPGPCMDKPPVPVFTTLAGLAWAPCRRHWPLRPGRRYAPGPWSGSWPGRRTAGG